MSLIFLSFPAKTRRKKIGQVLAKRINQFAIICIRILFPTNEQLNLIIDIKQFKCKYCLYLGICCREVVCSPAHMIDVHHIVRKYQMRVSQERIGQSDASVVILSAAVVAELSAHRQDGCKRKWKSLGQVSFLFFFSFVPLRSLRNAPPEQEDWVMWGRSLRHLTHALRTLALNRAEKSARSASVTSFTYLTKPRQGRKETDGRTSLPETNKVWINYRVTGSFASFSEN